MRYLIIIFLLFSVNCFATNYYISNTGSDAANGLTIGTAWQTLSKVNSFSFSSGDSIFLKRGNTWNEKLFVPASNMYFGSYGVGVKPLITGFQDAPLFTNVGNIWSATLSTEVKNLNSVLIDNKFSAKGRYPNTGYLTYNPGTSTKFKIETALSGTPNYTGAECVVRTNHWIIDVVKINSQSVGTINFLDSLTYKPVNSAGTGFFIQNSVSVLDTIGEWSFDAATKVLSVYSNVYPNVKVSVFDTLILIKNVNYVTIDGLSFSGSNMATILSDTANNITINNCDINYSGSFGISAKKSDYLKIQNNNINNSWNNAILLRDPIPVNFNINHCDNFLIDNNFIKNTGIAAGMGVSNNGTYMAIYGIGTPNTITNNVIDSVGYTGIYFNGVSLVEKNYIKNWCLNKDDGGGIYTFIGGAFSQYYDNGSIIRKNILINGGSTAFIGTGSSYSTAPAIYLDNATFGVKVDSNTIISAAGSGIMFNGPVAIILRENTVINDLGAGLNITLTGGYNWNIKKNIFYSKNTLQPVILLGYKILPSENIDSNYYLRPLLETGKLSIGVTSYSLPAWVSYTSFDANTKSTPTGITSDLPLILYNTSQSDSTINITGSYFDAKGVPHSNNITLKPFTSAILFKSVNETIQKYNLKLRKIRK